MKNYISVGITGGIGSGKSYVCQIIETMGYPVFYADAEAKKIINEDPSAIRAVTSVFGTEAYNKDGLNSTYIAQKVFKDNSLREELNAIIHPRVRQRFNDWALKSGSKIVFTEAAILFETGSYKNYDFICLITAPYDLKISRVKKRSGLSEEEIKSRMDSQWSDEKKIPLADFIIINDESEPLLPQVVNMIKQVQ
ncbi:MAG: dephospho-CoA kinase [Crocinitomicaceae bacterium]|nr:dephospho-CoA kinase [Crocinitomicaceae bacterium]